MPNVAHDYAVAKECEMELEADVDLSQEGRKRLRELCRTATPGPWKHSAGDNRVHNEKFLLALGMGAGFLSEEQILSNLDFIAEARTALPTLLDALEAIKKERDVARKALRKYGHHPPSCMCTSVYSTNLCTCGLRAALGEEPHGTTLD